MYIPVPYYNKIYTLYIVTDLLKYMHLYWAVIPES